VRDETTLGRSLWATVLVVAVVVVVVSFAQRPLVGDDTQASGFAGPPLTLWVPESGSETAAVAAQAASCWQMNNRAATVGVLPGGSAASVADFLSRSRRQSNQLLLITSTTLAEVAHDGGDPLLPEEPRERAQQAAHLLADAAPIAVLASDPLALAVPASSHIRIVAQLLSLVSDSAQPVFDVAANTWLRGNLAALVQNMGLHGLLPYRVFNSSREAVASLDAGDAQVLVAPHSAIRTDLSRGVLRELPWPGPGHSAPRAWIAILAPAGLPAHDVAALRRQARSLCSGAVWAKLLREDGLAPVAPRSVRLTSLVRGGLGEARRMQALATQVMRDYQ
jgi:hypothetical protein